MEKHQFRIACVLRTRSNKECIKSSYTVKAVKNGNTDLVTVDSSETKLMLTQLVLTLRDLIME